jgi:hypothetical protein
MFFTYWLILCIYFTLGNAVPELFFKDFQDQVFEESQLFSIYSVELELYDRKVCLCTYDYFTLFLLFKPNSNLMEITIYSVYYTINGSVEMIIQLNSGLCSIPGHKLFFI